MHIHAPSQPIFWAAVVLVVLALIGYFAPGTPFVSLYHFWIAIAAAVIVIVDCAAPDRLPQRKSRRKRGGRA